MNISTAWVDGAVGPAGDATVALTDPGFLTGHGVFETMLLAGGSIGHLDRHLERLGRSARIARVDVPLDGRALRGALAESVEAHLAGGGGGRGGGGLTRVRLTVTGGGSVSVLVADDDPWPPTTSLASIDAPIWERGPLVGAKTLSWGEGAWCRSEARRLGVGEVIRTDSTGHLSEGGSTNLFIVSDGQITTPSTANGCLPGITRGIVCEVMDVEVRDDLAPADLATAEEVFITSSTRGVQPVHEVDGQALIAPGPLTRVAARAYEAFEGP